jgi:micrococcal nuclease
MLQFKRRQPESEPAPARWKVGIDRQRVAAYVALALAAGFAAGLAVAKYLARTQPTTPAVSETAPQIRQAAADSLTGELHRVTRVVRGDTVEVDGVGPVRMIGIETPDGKSPREIYGVHGERAVSYVEKALLGQEVRLEYDAMVSRTQDSAPTLAYVYTRDGTLINGEMVRQGLAFLQSGEQFRLANDFRALEREAMQAMRGVWGSSSSESTAASASPAATPSPPTSDKPNKLSPLPPSAFGANIPALSGSTNSSAEQSIWVSPADKLYHKAGCQFLDKKKHLLSLSQAKTEGYTACSRCYASTLLKAP